jgi:hypothetical protein
MDVLHDAMLLPKRAHPYVRILVQINPSLASGIIRPDQSPKSIGTGVPPRRIAYYSAKGRLNQSVASDRIIDHAGVCTVAVVLTPELLATRLGRLMLPLTHIPRLFISHRPAPLPGRQVLTPGAAGDQVVVHAPVSARQPCPNAALGLADPRPLEQALHSRDRGAELREILFDSAGVVRRLDIGMRMAVPGGRASERTPAHGGEDDICFLLRVVAEPIERTPHVLTPC